MSDNILSMKKQAVTVNVISGGYVLKYDLQPPYRSLPRYNGEAVFTDFAELVHILIAALRQGSYSEVVFGNKGIPEGELADLLAGVVHHNNEAIESFKEITRQRVLQQAVMTDKAPGHMWVDVPEV